MGGMCDLIKQGKVINGVGSCHCGQAGNFDCKGDWKPLLSEINKNKASTKICPQPAVCDKYQWQCWCKRCDHPRTHRYCRRCIADKTDAHGNTIEIEFPLTAQWKNAKYH